MKNLILIMTVLSIGFFSCDKDDDVKITDTPTAVQTSFEAKFPNATAVSSEKKGNDYEVDFRLNNVEHEALFTAEGTLVKYKYDVLLSVFPESIKTTVSTDYEGKTIDDTEALVIDGATYYQLELDNSPQDMKLVFNADGTLNTQIPYWD